MRAKYYLLYYRTMIFLLIFKNNNICIKYMYIKNCKNKIKLLKYYLLIYLYNIIT